MLRFKGNHEICNVYIDPVDLTNPFLLAPKSFQGNVHIDMFVKYLIIPTIPKLFNFISLVNILEMNPPEQWSAPSTTSFVKTSSTSFL